MDNPHSDQPEANQIGVTAAPPDISAKIQEAAQLEVRAGYTAKTAAAVVENSDFVKSQFPGSTQQNEDVRNAAYGYLMNKQGMDGYPSPPKDDALLSAADKAKLNGYLKDHPALDQAKIEKEAGQLRALGFPTLSDLDNKP